MKMCLLAPAVVLLVALVCTATADKPSSLISSLLDVLPKLEKLRDNRVDIDPLVAAAEAKKAQEAMDIFTLFVPFVRTVVEQQAKTNKEPVPEKTLKTLEVVEDVLPTFFNVILSLSAQPRSNSNDEPLLADFTDLVSRESSSERRQFNPRISQIPETPTIEKKALGNVFQQTNKLLSQISKSDSDEAPTVRVQPAQPSNFYISAETTPQPQPRRRRPSSRRTYTTTPTPRPDLSSEETEVPKSIPTPPPTQRPTYAPPTPAPRADPDEDDVVRTYSTSTRVSSGTQPGSSVSFFNLPTARSTRRQRVTRGSDYQVKPQRYFYVE